MPWKITFCTGTVGKGIEQGGASMPEPREDFRSAERSARGARHGLILVSFGEKRR